MYQLIKQKYLIRIQRGEIINSAWRIRRLERAVTIKSANPSLTEGKNRKVTRNGWKMSQSRRIQTKRRESGVRARVWSEDLHKNNQKIWNQPWGSKENQFYEPTVRPVSELSHLPTLNHDDKAYKTWNGNISDHMKRLELSLKYHKFDGSDRITLL